MRSNIQLNDYEQMDTEHGKTNVTHITELAKQQRGKKDGTHPPEITYTAGSLSFVCFRNN